MTTHKCHDNHNSQGKSSNCPEENRLSQGHRDRRLSASRLRRGLCRYGGLLVFLCLLGLMWTAADIRADDESSGSEQAPSNTQSAKSEPNDSQAAGKPETQAESDQSASAESDTSAEEDALFKAFEEYAAAAEKDPDSAEAQALEKKLGEAMDRLQRKMEGDPGASLEKLPAAPSKSGAEPAQASEKKPPEPVKQEAAQKPTSEKPTTEAPPSKTAPVSEQPATTQPTEPETGQAQTEEPTIAESAVSDKEVEAGAAQVTMVAAEADEVNLPEPNDDDIVQLKMEDSQLDIQYLLDYVGKEMHFNFLYETTEPITGKVLLQMYGDIRRRDLMPLLESVLSFRGYTLVREGAFIRITKRTEVLKKTQSILSIGPEMPEVTPGDTIVSQIIEVKHVGVNNVVSLLSQFISTPNSMINIPRTNYLIITEYAQRMPRLLELYRLMDQPGPPKRLEVLEVEYLKAAEAKSRVEELLKALTEQGVIEAAATETPEAPTPPAGGARPTAGRPRPSTARPRTEPASITVEEKGATIFVDQRMNRLLVIGTDEQITQIVDLLGIIDLEPPVPDIELVPVRIKHVLAKDVSQQIQALLKSLNEQRGATSETETVARRTTPPRTPSRTARPTPTPSRSRTQPVPTATVKGPVLHVDDRTNRLFIIGTAEHVEEVMELLALLDVVEGPEIKLTVIRVEHVEAKAVAGQIEQLIKALNEQGAESATPTAPAGQPETPAAKPPASGKTPETPTPPTPRSTAARSVTTPQAAGITKQGPVIFIDERTNRLLVIGSDEQIAQVNELLALLDVVEGPEIKLVDIRVKHVLAEDVAKQIEELLKALNEQSGSSSALTEPQGITRPPTATPATARERTAPPSTRTTIRQRESTIAKEGPAIFVDARTNRLLVVGSEEQIRQVRQLLTLLDVVEGPEIKLVAFEVQYVLAADISGQLNELMSAFAERDTSLAPANITQTTAPPGRERNQPPPMGDRPRQDTAATRQTQRTAPSSRSEKGSAAGPFILVDDRTNRLLVIGSDEQIEQLSELLIILDVPPSEYDRLVLRVYQPQFVEAAEVQRILDQLGITKPQEPSYRDRVREERSRGEPGGPSLTEEPQPSASTVSAEVGLPSLAGPARLLPGQEEPEIRIAIQETTNRIFVLATEYQLHNIEEILKHVDIEPEEAMGAIQVYPLENREPTEVASMLQDLLDARREQQGVEKSTVIPGAEGAPVIVPFEKTYAIIVQASKKQHEEISSIIEILDKRLPQVLVEAILVQVSTTDALNLGIQLQQTYDVGGARNTTRRVSGISPFGLAPPAFNTAGTFVTGTGGTLAFFDDDVIFATLEALQTEGNTKVISMPRITVNDNEPATITSERKEPTTRTTIPVGSDTPIIEFKDYVNAGTNLTITPNISEGEFLKLTIGISVNSFDGVGSENVPPPQSNNSIDTVVTVPDRKTIVLGGLTTSTNSITVNKIPLLGDLPLIGGLFRNVSHSESEAVLYVFVKAHIIRSDVPGVDEFDNLSEKYRNQLRDSELEYYRKSSLLPGLPADKRKNRHILEEED